jgi:hypothetical protein
MDGTTLAPTLLALDSEIPAYPRIRSGFSAWRKSCIGRIQGRGTIPVSSLDGLRCNT